jgi:hypothetical protein
MPCCGTTALSDLHSSVEHKEPDTLTRGVHNPSEVHCAMDGKYHLQFMVVVPRSSVSDADASVDSIFQILSTRASSQRK